MKKNVKIMCSIGRLKGNNVTKHDKDTKTTKYDNSNKDNIGLK